MTKWLVAEFCAAGPSADLAVLGLDRREARVRALVNRPEQAGKVAFAGSTSACGHFIQEDRPDEVIRHVFTATGALNG